MKKANHKKSPRATRRDANPGSPLGRAFRSLTGANGLIVSRRARRDLGLLTTVVALTATATVLAVTGPALVLETVDGGVRETLERAGSAADVTLNGSILTPRENSADLSSFYSASDVLAFETTLADALPGTLASVVGHISLSVLSGEGIVSPRTEDLTGTELSLIHI